MSEECSLLEKVEALSRQSAADHVVSAIKAIMNAVPVVGGPVASLMDDYIPASREKRLNEFAQHVAEEMERLSNKLSTEYVRTDQYAYLFTKVFQDVSRDYQAEKLAAYRNILVNALRYDIDAAIQEGFLRRVEELTALHIGVLSWFSDDEKVKQIVASKSMSPMSLTQTFQILIPGVNGDYIRAALHDLDMQGITGNMAQALKVTMTADGATSLEGRLTLYGQRFVHFISQHE